MITIKYFDTYIKDWYTIAGPEERRGNIHNINMYMKDLYYGCETHEQAEIKMQKIVLNNLNVKNNYNLVIGGDLSNQIANMNKTLSLYPLSFLGIYNACATFIEGIIMASNMLNITNNICVLTSSHALTSERQFRNPNEYGSLKKSYTTVTITAAVGGIISKEKSKYKIVSSTIGEVVDENITDAYNIGAIMAPAAAKTINEHLKNTSRSMDDYDFILTGDLGYLGVDILKQVLKDTYRIDTDKIIDAGTMIYKRERFKFMGGSGPSVLPVVLFNKVFHMRNLKRILVVGTGALHNPTLVNQKLSIPGIAHAIEIEVE